MEMSELVAKHRTKKGVGDEWSDPNVTCKCAETVEVEKYDNVGGSPCLKVEDRYYIYLDNGTVFDSITGSDIPARIFTIRNIVVAAARAVKFAVEEDGFDLNDLY